MKNGKRINYPLNEGFNRTKRKRQTRRVLYQSERDKDDELDEDKDVGRIHLRGIEHVAGEGLEVGGDEAHVGTNETNLRDSDGKKDRETHSGSIEMSSNVTKGSRHHLTGLDQEQEREEGDGGNGYQEH